MSWSGSVELTLLEPLEVNFGRGARYSLLPQHQPNNQPAATNSYSPQPMPAPRPAAQPPRPPQAGGLVLSVLPDEPLAATLEKHRGRGRDNYAIRPTWNALLAGA